MTPTELLEQIAEVDAEADSLVLEFQARVANSATAKQVDATRRRYELTGDRLVTTFAMAAVGQPMTHHLHSDMRRV